MKTLLPSSFLTVILSLPLSQCTRLECPPDQELGAVSCVCSSTLEPPVNGTCVQDACSPDGCPCSQEGIEAAIARGGTQIIQCDESAPPILTTGTILIDNPVTLEGRGDPLIQGDTRHLLFEVEAVEAELIGFTINSGKQGIRVPTGATVTLRDCVVVGNVSSASAGGGIFNAGDLTLVNTRVESNIVETGPGGGIYNDRSGVLTLTGSTVLRNVAEEGHGGGIFNARGTLVVNDSEIAENNAPEGDGGGLGSEDGTVTITGSLIRENTTRWFGGGIATWGFSAMTEITDSTITGNRATSNRHGGGIRAQHGELVATRTTWSRNEARNDGGGILVEGDATVFTLIDSTVTENIAGGVGGGIRLWENADAQIINTTIFDNTAADGGALHLGFGASAEVSSCTISNNDDVGRLGISISERESASITHDGSSLSFIQTLIDDTCVALRPITSLNHNIESPENTCQLDESNDSVSVLPNDLNLADQLADNEGTTQSLMLTPPSLAIDYALSTCDQAKDQRGKVRPQGPRCDIGSVEVD